MAEDGETSQRAASTKAPEDEGAPAARTGSTASGAVAPTSPVLPQGSAVGSQPRGSQQGSRRESVVSRQSQKQLEATVRSHVSGVAASRQGSQLSAVAPQEPPPVEEPPVEQMTPEAQLAERDAELADSKREAAKLQAQVDSLTRLMQGGSQDAKIKTLNDEVGKRAEAIKKLEEEVKKEKKRADAAEKRAADAEEQVKTEKRKTVEARRSSMQPAAAARSEQQAQQRPEDSRALQEKERQVAELQADLRQRAAQAQKAEERAAAAEKRAAVPQIPPEAQKLIVQLQQSVALKTAELQQTQMKLDDAREAIVDAAGCGFDNDVRLHQARSALRNILKKAESAQPPQPAAGPSRSPAGSPASPPSHMPNVDSVPRNRHSNPAEAAAVWSPSADTSPAPAGKAAYTTSYLMPRSTAHPRSVSPTRARPVVGYYMH